MFICTAVIVTTMAASAYYIAATIKRYSTPSSEWELRAMERQLDSIDEHLKSIDDSVMTPGEYLRRAQLPRE